MERDIVSIDDVDEEEWGGTVRCMDEKCQKEAAKEISSTYPGDDRRFFTCLCRDHMGEYAIAWEENN